MHDDDEYENPSEEIKNLLHELHKKVNRIQSQLMWILIIGAALISYAIFGWVGLLF